MLSNELGAIAITEIGLDIPNLLQCSYLYRYFIRYAIGNDFPLFFFPRTGDPVQPLELLNLLHLFQLQ